LYRPGAGGERTSGYRGRTGVYELVPVDEAMRRLIHDGAAEADLERHARELAPSILDDGWRLCREGITSVEEVLRVTRES
jgi:general secretion pathway protein E